MKETHTEHLEGGTWHGDCLSCLSQDITTLQDRNAVLKERIKELVACHTEVMALAGEPFHTEGGIKAHNRRVDRAVAAANACLE